MTERGRRLETLDAVARHAAFDVPFTLTHDVTHFYGYDAFGNTIARSGTSANNLLYCGEQFDPDLGLYFLRARYMDTDRGRFWTMDTTMGTGSRPFSLHKYLYGDADPVGNVDPNGQLTLPEIAFATAVGMVVFGVTLHETMRIQANRNWAYAVTLPETPITVHGKLYYGLTLAGRRIVEVHEEVHQQQGLFDPFKFGEAEIELPAYQTDRNYARFLLAVGNLTEAERKEVLEMLEESNAMIHKYAAELGVDAK